VFYEHVHFNFDGNYLLGRAWADQIAPLLPANLASPQTGHWASQSETEARLGLTDWNRASVLEDMILRLQQAPFTGQLYQSQRLATFRGSLAEVRRRCGTNAIPAARAIYDQAISSQPRDHRLRENFAEFLEATGDLALATAQWREVAALLPHHHLAYFQAGRLLALQGKTADAKSLLNSALERRPDLSEGWFELGKIYAAENNLPTSLAMFARAQKLFPEDWRVYFQIGKCLSKRGDRAEAIAQFRTAVRLRPKSWQARNALAQELAFDGQDQEALNQFQEVLKLNPGYSGAHLNLGVALFKLGRTKEAKAQFGEALRLEPGNQLAQDYLRQLEKVP
jgi:tetratricopeptide (TPR) repeat protein